MKQKQYWGMALVILCLPLLKIMTVSALGIGSFAPLLQSDALGWKFPLVRLGFFLLLWLMVNGLALSLHARGVPLVSLVFVPLMYALQRLFLFMGAWVWWSPVTTYGLPLTLLAAAGLVYLGGRRTAMVKYILSGLVLLLATLIIAEASGLKLGLFFWAALGMTVAVLLGRVLLQSGRPSWRGLLLALTAISVGTAVALFLPGEAPGSIPELSEEQQVQAAVFRHVIGEYEGQVYLSLGRHTDPELALLRSLADLPARVFGGSRAYIARPGVWDKLSMDQGVWYFISNIEWLEPDKVRVDWACFYAPLGGNGGVLHLYNTPEGWQLEDRLLQREQMS